MSEHTGGEWYVEPGDDGDDSVGLAPTPPTVEAELGDGGDPVTICVLRETGRAIGREPENEFDECFEWVGTTEGNGHLIAAAPDLLAACVAAIDSGITSHNHWDDTQRHGDGCPLWEPKQAPEALK